MTLCAMPLVINISCLVPASLGYLVRPIIVISMDLVPSYIYLNVRWQDKLDSRS